MKPTILLTLLLTLTASAFEFAGKDATVAAVETKARTAKLGIWAMPKLAAILNKVSKK